MTKLLLFFLLLFSTTSYSMRSGGVSRSAHPGYHDLHNPNILLVVEEYEGVYDEFEDKFLYKITLIIKNEPEIVYYSWRQKPESFEEDAKEKDGSKETNT